MAEREHEAVEDARSVPESALTPAEIQILAARIAERHVLTPLALRRGETRATTDRAEVPARALPGGEFMFDAESRHERTIYTFRVPYDGSEELWDCRPSSFNTTAPHGDVEPGVLEVVVPDLARDGSQVKAAFETQLREIEWYVERVNADLGGFGARLRSVVTVELQRRQAESRQSSQLLHQMGIPMDSKRTDRPLAAVQPRHPAPGPLPRDPRAFAVVSTEQFQRMLEVIERAGDAMERTATSHAARHEEELRDEILVALNAAFKGGAAGEVFNKRGKTDLHVVEDGRTLLIGECKWWNGAVGVTRALDQLLGNLTVHDGKAVLVCFVREGGFTDIVGKLHDAVRGHPCCRAPLGPTGRSGRNYHFNLPGDPGAMIELSTLAFHLPPSPTPRRPPRGASPNRDLQ